MCQLPLLRSCNRLSRNMQSSASLKNNEDGGSMLESLKLRVLHSLPASVLYVTRFADLLQGEERSPVRKFLFPVSFINLSTYSYDLTIYRVWKEVLSGGAILALPASSFPSRGNDMSRSSALSSFASKKYLLKSCKQRLSGRLKEKTGFKIVSEKPRLLSTNC